MKKILFAAPVILAVLLLTSCNSSNSGGGMSDKAKKNLDATNGVTKMFETNDWSKTGDYIASDATDHTTPKGEVKGLDNIKALFAEYAGTMKDVKNETVRELADDDYSMIWLKQSWTATKDDPMMHMKAGDKGSMETVEVCKHNADGKITDHWSFMSMNDMMKMMPEGMNNMGGNTSGNMSDSSKMHK